MDTSEGRGGGGGRSSYPYLGQSQIKIDIQLNQKSYGLRKMKILDLLYQEKKIEQVKFF